MFKLIKSIKSPKGHDIELYTNNVAYIPSVLIIGGFHGDEPDGVKIMKKYIKLNLHTENNLYIIPCLNPDGFFAGSRVNSNGVDLNRNFPTENWELQDEDERDEYFGGKKAASELETRFLIQAVKAIEPKVILSIHSPYGVVNYDEGAGGVMGEYKGARGFAEEISELTEYPVEESIGYPTPGSFGTWAGIERGIPVITLELAEGEPFEILYDKCVKIFSYLGYFNFGQ